VELEVRSSAADQTASHVGCATFRAARKITARSRTSMRTNVQSTLTVAICVSRVTFLAVRKITARSKISVRTNVKRTLTVAICGSCATFLAVRKITTRSRASMSTKIWSTPTVHRYTCAMSPAVTIGSSTGGALARTRASTPHAGTAAL
jgi:hypothetical protein